MHFTKVLIHTANAVFRIKEIKELGHPQDVLLVQGQKQMFKGISETQYILRKKGSRSCISCIGKNMMIDKPKITVSVLSAESIFLFSWILNAGLNGVTRFKRRSLLSSLLHFKRRRHIINRKNKEHSESLEV
jgi:hypothetical protein